MPVVDVLSGGGEQVALRRPAGRSSRCPGRSAAPRAAAAAGRPTAPACAPPGGRCTTMTAKAPRYSDQPGGQLAVQAEPTFAKANATSAKTKTSMISSVRRLLRGRRDQRSVGSTAGVGAVMLLTGTSPRPAGSPSRSSRPRGARRQGTGRDAERLGLRAQSPGRGGLRAGLGMLAVGFFGLLGLGHFGVVLVLRGLPVLPAPCTRRGSCRRRCWMFATICADAGQAARAVVGLHRLLVVRRDLGQRDPGLLIRLDQLNPAMLWLMPR